MYALINLIVAIVGGAVSIAAGIAFAKSYGNTVNTAIIVPLDTNFIVQRVRDRKFYGKNEDYVRYPRDAFKFFSANSAHQKANKLGFKEILLKIT